MSHLSYREHVEGIPFGRYQLIDVLGRGGMGEVWRARDTVIDRVVAVKLLLPHYAADPEFNERFRREARAAAQLDDPHVVPIYDVGEIDGRLFVAMRLINGVNLQTLLDAGPLDPERAVHIVEQVASALHSAHRVGLVHRDVKPSNILLTDNNSRADFAYLIDFGIARTASDSALTSAGTALGTWAYMAPERFSSSDGTGTQTGVDVYALTCVLYQCLTGGVPYPGDTLEQVAGGHMVKPPPQPSVECPTVPTAMDRVIATGLAKKPAERYPGTVALAAAARDALTQPIGRPDPAYASPHQALSMPTAVEAPPARSRRARVVLGAVAAAALVAAGTVAAVHFTRDDDTHPASPSPSTTNAPPPNTGPLTGVFRADYGPVTYINDAPGPDRIQPRDTYAIASVCRPTGCLATAERLDGTTALAQPAVLDQVGDRWIAVTLIATPCKADAATEAWEVLVLQSRPDGTLAGEYTATTTNGCTSKRTVAFTRTGDVDLTSLPDPNALPPRVVSPAEALHGWYHHTRTFPMLGQRQDTDYQVRTDCLRTGDRCISFYHGNAGEVLPLDFRDGHWNFFTENESSCRGNPMQVRKSAQYQLPQPSESPIPSLAGHGRQDQTGSCAINVEFDDTFTRTGD